MDQKMNRMTPSPSTKPRNRRKYKQRIY